MTVKIRLVAIIQIILTDHSRVPSSVRFFLLNFKLSLAQEMKTRDITSQPQSVTASLKIANTSKLLTCIFVFALPVTRMPREKTWPFQNLEDCGKKVSTRLACDR